VFFQGGFLASAFAAYFCKTSVDFNGLHDIISHKIELFVTNTMRTSNLKCQFLPVQKFLPTFPENDSEEKEETLRLLFARENLRFGSPLSDFQVQLMDGYYRPDIAKMRSLMRKAQFREYK
jgi:hypothetical protein